MTSLRSSAPGKVVLLGEYAVLFGARALVAAVNRRARVSLTTTDQLGHLGHPGKPDQCDQSGQSKPGQSTQPEWTVDSPALGVRCARASLAPGGQVRWDDRGAAHRLGLVAAVLSALHRDGRAPSAHIGLDTAELYAQNPLGGHRRTKLGLGSSAALTVALAGALAAASGGRELSASELSSTHRLLQDGRGSGIDIAAALHGGVLEFSHGLAGPQAHPVTLPIALSWRSIWTGRPASTQTFLARIATWHAAEPDRHDRLMARLAQASAAGVDAAQRQDAAAVLDAVDISARLLEHLGEVSGADIVCEEHRRLSAVAAECGVSYKSCGAGGGDIGVAFTTEPDRLTTFAEQAEQAGFHPLDLAVDPRGLSVHHDPS